MKLGQRRFKYQDIRKRFFTRVWLATWNRLPREVSDPGVGFNDTHGCLQLRIFYD